MRILVEPSARYLLVNRGDAASLYVGLSRLRALWPEAAIEVLSDDPDQLRLLAPSVTTQPTSGLRHWNRGETVASVLPTALARKLTWFATSAAATMGRRRPGARHRFRHTSVPTSAARADIDRYVAAVANADLVVVTGMGGITEEFGSYATGLLGTLDLAFHHGVPTAMMSQQVGPIVSRRLERASRRVLPNVDLIALREGETGRPVLRRLGVDLDRVRTTGDDAITLAYDMRHPRLGAGIGLNLRTAGYARMGAQEVERVGAVVRAASSRLGARLVGLPISHNADEDSRAIEQMIGGSGPGAYPAVVDLSAFLALVQRCRIVVTGSYHAAVFTLGQGIPAVCLTNSPYYDQKFIGLAALFGEGCEVVHVRREMPELQEAMERVWDRAEDLRAPLLEAARRQIDMGRAAYADLRQLVADRVRGL